MSEPRKPTRQPKSDRWFEEDQSDILRVRYRMEQTLYAADSEHQRVEVARSAGFGRMLINDGTVMLSERDERIYHEMIAHVPLFVLPRAERVLVIGGGDGGTVREVLRHESVEHCRLVEIDAKVLEACRKHIPQTAAALEDSRVEVSVEDGVAFVARTEDRYDLVIVDSSDPVGPAVPLFGEEFYGHVQRVADQVARLRDHAEGGTNATLTVDLENQVITGQDGDPIPFDVDPFRKHCLLEGLDDIGLTIEKAAHIDDYESAQRTQQPWLWR